MFGLFRGKKKIPDGMIELKTFPIDDNGEPTWTREIEQTAPAFSFTAKQVAANKLLRSEARPCSVSPKPSTRMGVPIG